MVVGKDQYELMAFSGSLGDNLAVAWAKIGVGYLASKN